MSQNTGVYPLNFAPLAIQSTASIPQRVVFIEFSPGFALSHPTLGCFYMQP